MFDKTYTHCEVISNKCIADGVFDMTVRSDSIAASTIPGQFAGIYTGSGDLILPRPISVCCTDTQNGTVRFVYRVAGSGTELFSNVKPGGRLRILAPLGNGYPIFPEHKKVAVVGGGIGIPPLLFLTRELLPNADVTAVLGYRNEAFLVNDFNNLGAEILIATDDGNVGFKGNTIQLLDSVVEQFDVIYGCGPKVMLKFLASWADSRNIPCYISLEERMGCGFGACVGCVCSVSDRDGNSAYKKVCVDGPVFNAREVDFN